MNSAGVIIIAVVSIFTGIFLLRIDKPAKSKPKITGRGGDFEA